MDHTLTFSHLPKVTISSGGQLENAVGLAAVKSFGRVIDVYGSTETGGIAFREVAREQTQYHLFDGVEILQTGPEILLSSPFTESNPMLIEDDLEVFPGRRIQLLGRKDRIAKIEDVRVSLSEIENLATSIPDVEQCYASVMNWKNRQHIAVAIAGLIDTDRQQSIRIALCNTIRDAIGPLAIPKQFLFVNQMPLNTQGKICRQTILEHFHGQG